MFLNFGVYMVGTTGFEPATSRTPSVRATRLRHVPTLLTSISVSLAFEKGQDGEQFFSQLKQETAIHARSGLRKISSTILLGAFCRIHRVLNSALRLGKMFPRSSDGKALFVEEALDLKNRLDVFPAIQPMARRAFYWLKRGEFRFPKPQDESLRIRQTTYFTDAEKALLWNFSLGLCGTGHD